MTDDERRAKTKEIQAELARLSAETKIMELRRKALNARYDAAETELQLFCLHEDIENKVEHYEGGYYDRASTERWRRCKTCGTTSERVTETHSWYG
jgi:hypothetical protein